MQSSIKALLSLAVLTIILPTFANPIKNFIDQHEGQYWLSYRVPLEANNDGCCFDDNWGSHWRRNCSLAEDSREFVGQPNPTLVVDSLQVFIQVDGGEATNVRSFLANCTVNTANQTVHALASVTTEESVEFLTALIDKPNYDEFSKRSLMTIALHAGNPAQKTLERYASEEAGSKAERERREDAIFWLGNARNDRGFKYLTTLFQEVSDTKLRKHIIFAISINESGEALSTLSTIATKDANPELRSAALFWLAESNYPDSLNLILAAIENDSSYKVRQEAVFNLSRIGSLESFNELAKLAQTYPDHRVQTQAIFWLAKSNNSRAKSILIDMLHEDHVYAIKEEIVFALSQLEPPQATSALVYVIENSHDSRLVKKALFWLNQSDDPEALAFVASMFSQ